MWHSFRLREQREVEFVPLAFAMCSSNMVLLFPVVIYLATKQKMNFIEISLNLTARSTHK